LRVLSAGAAKGVVEALADAFQRDAGVEIAATFGAVGAIKQKLDAGDGCDAIVLTQRMIDELADENRVLVETVAPLGAVHTCIAVRDGDPLPNIDSAASLRTAIIGTNAIFLPDIERATAGAHLANILQKPGIDRDVGLSRRPSPT